MARLAMLLLLAGMLAGTTECEDRYAGEVVKNVDEKGVAGASGHDDFVEHEDGKDEDGKDHDAGVDEGKACKGRCKGKHCKREDHGKCKARDCKDRHDDDCKKDGHGRHAECDAFKTDWGRFLCERLSGGHHDHEEDCERDEDDHHDEHDRENGHATM